MAGRLVGETIDNRGQRAYVLTLTAREQHIKRERHIQHLHEPGLDRLGTAVYLPSGKEGLRQVAELCYQKRIMPRQRSARSTAWDCVSPSRSSTNLPFVLTVR